MAYGASAVLNPRASLTLFERLFAWHEAGVLDPCVTDSVLPHEAIAAIRAMRDRVALGKPVIDFSTAF